MAKVEFRCIIPNVQSSLKFGADEARVTFEVPACDVQNAVALIALKGVNLKVTVEVETLTDANENAKDGNSKTKRRTARNPLDVARG